MWQKPAHPWLYEINTRVWLHELRQQYKGAFGLAGVPDEQWRALKDLGMDLIWLMGVWSPSQASQEIALAHPDLQREYNAALPDFSPSDVAGSPYAVAGYQLNPLLGGPDDLARLKDKLNQMGLGLILDLVPNHTAIDHPWCEQRPELYVTSRQRGYFPPDAAFECGEAGQDPWWTANGRDPYFPPWSDTAQLNAYSPQTRKIMAETLAGLEKVCDGLRCDMAMLCINRIFGQTWRDWITASQTAAPAQEFWPEVAGPARAQRPGFLLIAEAYWGTEGELLSQGFDYCYDKGGLDLLVSLNAADLSASLAGEGALSERMVRFLENHDELRIASRLSSEALQPVTVAFVFSPGMKLFLHGQLSGNRLKLPVQLSRGPREQVNSQVEALYGEILPLANQPLFKEGEFLPLKASPQPGGELGARGLLAQAFRQGRQFGLVVANFSEGNARGGLGGPGLPSAQNLRLAAWGPGHGQAPSLRDLPGGLGLDYLAPWGWAVWLAE